MSTRYILNDTPTILDLGPQRRGIVKATEAFRIDGALYCKDFLHRVERTRSGPAVIHAHRREGTFQVFQAGVWK